MLDFRSTNNWYGWLFYFAAHLITACGVSRDKLFLVLNREYNDAHNYYVVTNVMNHYCSKYMSDNQCIMLSHRWFFSVSESGLIRAWPHNPTVVGEREVWNENALNYWIEQAKH